MRDASWVRRMMAAQRLERWGAEEYAAKHLATLARDADPRVRTAAVLALSRVGTAPIPALLEEEQDPRVVRTMLRCGWPVDAQRVERGARALMKSSVPGERLLGVEIAAALDRQQRASRGLAAQARDTLTSVVARLDHQSAGSLSPRLALLTGAPDVRDDAKWRRWLSRRQGPLTLDGGWLAPTRGQDLSTPITRLSTDEFARFATALNNAFRQPIDLAIVIDCTRSMANTLAQAQAGVNDVMLFAGAMAPGTRVGIVGYRDRGEDWTTRAWDFTTQRTEAQRNLWSLRADGGGDEPEMVYEALKLALKQLSWRSGDVQRVLVLVGDAPPHVGFRQKSADLVQQGKARGITTYVLSARPSHKTEEVPHFPEIARAGGGRVIRLSERHDLAAELAGIAMADTWHDHIVDVFERYLLLCR